MKRFLSMILAAVLGASLTIAASVGAAYQFETFQGWFRAADGTAAAPGIAFDDDLDTGFFWPGAGIIGAASGGSEIGGVNGSGFYLEGATADAFETTIAGTDVGADVTATVPGGGDAAFSFFPSTLTSNDVDVANSVWGVSNGLRAEGATADAFETSLAFTDVGADVTATIPGGGDAAFAFVPSSLTTNDVDVANSCWFTSNGFTCEGTTADGFEVIEAMGDPGQDVTYTRPDIASGAYTYGEFQETICTGPLVTGSVDTMGFVATRAYTILDIDEIHQVAESAGTVGIMPERLQGTEDIASGDDLLTGAFDGTATANTVQNGTQSATTTLAAGDRVALDFTDDTPGELLNVCVSLRLRPN